MKRTVYTQEEIKENLRPIFADYGVRRAVLFGSYGKGTATEKSDVDIMVDSSLRGLDFAGLIEDIREGLGDKEVDVIDVSQIIPDSLIDREIRRTGVELYAR